MNHKPRSPPGPFQCHPPGVMETPMDLYPKEEIEEIVVMERLHLYNRAIPCGAQAIKNLLDQEGVRPLPSLSTIKRILSRNCLTCGRTGYYPGDENREWK